MFLFIKFAEDSGLDEKYRIVAVPKPVQALNEQEMLQVLESWSARYANTQDHERLNKIRHLFYHHHNSIENIISYLESVEENINHIENAIQNIAHQLANANIPMTNTFIPLHHMGKSTAKQHIQQATPYAPKEGQEW